MFTGKNQPGVGKSCIVFSCHGSSRFAKIAFGRHGSVIDLNSDVDSYKGNTAKACKRDKFVPRKVEQSEDKGKDRTEKAQPVETYEINRH